jgi:hypothetical protein
MKKCAYCGKEYPDEATACAIDGEPLGHFAPSSGIPPSSVMSIMVYAVLSTFCGVGVAWTVVATIANHMNHASGANNADPISGGPGDAFVAHSIPILVVAGAIGFFCWPGWQMDYSKTQKSSPLS